MEINKKQDLAEISLTTKTNFAIVAPTGLAAINVGGSTMHSQFMMKHGVFPPDDPTLSIKNILKTSKLNGQKLEFLEKLDLLIIDEVSMVRPDQIDMIDRILRAAKRIHDVPFGGVQVVMVGDPCQLPPVITPDVKVILDIHYNGYYFFHAIVFRHQPILLLEFKKVYRQKDTVFLELLNRIRIGTQTLEDIEKLNERYCPEVSTEGKELEIHITTTNKIAHYTNTLRLNQLSGEEHVFNGELKGIYNDNQLPTEIELKLKVGAQVLFVKNDPDQRWVNGTIGKVIDINKDLIKVKTKDGTYTINQVMWENNEFRSNHFNKTVTKYLLGTFTQYPLKLGWAITIHKSQGMTFDNVYIHTGRGAFANGQLYVALSRCTSLEGIKLATKIKVSDVMVSSQVLSFLGRPSSDDLIEEAFSKFKYPILKGVSTPVF